MQLTKLLDGIDCAFDEIKADTEISTPVTDSREAVDGSLFVCIKGSCRNGADYIEEAVKNGAAAYVTEKDMQLPKSDLGGAVHIVTDDTRLCAAAVWNNYYGRPAKDMRLYGITGTNGKTSTAEFLESVLRCSGRKCGIIGTLGCRACGERIENSRAEVSDTPAAMTTPDPKYLYGALAHMKSLGITDVVMEVSSHALLQKKTAPLDFEWGIFTNLSPEHLDTHGTMENYFAAKASLFEHCRHALVNADDPWASRVSGIRAGAWLAHNVHCGLDGVSYTLGYAGKSLNIRTRVAGSYTVYNTMLAAVCALEAGIEPYAVEEGIAAVKSVCGRTELIADRASYGIDVIIDYAHTPDAMRAALSGLRRKGGYLTVVFGCGGDRDSEKRPLMGRAAYEMCDRVIVTSDNPRTEDRGKIIDDILRGIPDGGCAVIPDRRSAIAYAIESARPGETVALMGKGHENYETDAEGKHSFSERDICRDVLRRKFGR